VREPQDGPLELQARVFLLEVARVVDSHFRRRDFADWTHSFSRFLSGGGLRIFLRLISATKVGATATLLARTFSLRWRLELVTVGFRRGSGRTQRRGDILRVVLVFRCIQCQRVLKFHLNEYLKADQTFSKHDLLSYWHTEQLRNRQNCSCRLSTMETKIGIF
jgi:hypothetical protein